MSVDRGIIECMFEQSAGPAPEVGAGFEGMAERFAQRTRTEESAGWVARICAGARMENQATGQMLLYPPWHVFVVVRDVKVLVGAASAVPALPGSTRLSDVTIFE